MDKIDKLKQEVKPLSLAVRRGLAAAIAALVLLYDLLAVAVHIPYFEQMFLEMNIPGSLPFPTKCLVEMGQPTAIGISIVAVVVISLLFARTCRAWVVPVAVATAVLAAVLLACSYGACLLPILSRLRAVSEGP